MKERSGTPLALMAAVLLLVTGSAVGAQETTSTTEPEPSTDPAPTTTTLSVDPESTRSQTFEDAGVGETTLLGTYGSQGFFFPVPAGSTARAARLTLDYTPSPLLVTRSTLTIFANGVAVATARPADGEGRQRWVVDIPGELLGDDGVFVTIRGFLRLTDDDCEETDNPGQFITIHRTSALTYVTEPSEPDLADLARLTAGFPADRVVGITADSGLLDAAARVAWQIGRWHAERQVDPVIVAGDAPADAEVIVDTGVDVDAEGDGPTLAVTGTDPISVVVTGGDDDEVMAAASAFADPSTSEQLTGRARVITGERPAPEPARAEPWQGETTTFAQLGIEARDVVGLGTREVVLPVDRPPGWEIGDDVVLELDLDASPAMQSTSVVQVFVNGIDVGTRSLRTDDIQPVTHRFDIDGGLLNRRLDGGPVRTLDLQLRFVLDLPEERCSSVDPDAARVTVLPTSNWTVPHAYSDDLELGRFPAPLFSDAQDGPVPVTIIVGDDGDDALSAGLQLAAAIGRADPSRSAAPLLTTVEEVGSSPPGPLALIGDDAAALVEDRDLGHLEAAAAPRGAEVLGTVSLSRSPFDDESNLLVIRGDADGALATARALASRGQLNGLRGTAAVVVGEVPTPTEAADAAQPPAALAPLDPDDPLVENYTVPALVTLAAVVLLVGAFIRFRWWPGRRSSAP